MRTKINENTKVTLTIKQLKRLVKEAAADADKSYMSPQEFLNWHDNVVDPRKDREKLDRIYDIIDRAHVDCDDVFAEYIKLSAEDKKKVTDIVRESALKRVKEAEEIQLTASDKEWIDYLKRDREEVMRDKAEDPEFQEMLSVASKLSDADVCKDFGWENSLSGSRLLNFEAARWKHTGMIIDDSTHHTEIHETNARGTVDSYSCPCGFAYKVDSSD